MSCHVMSCHVMSCYTVLYYIVLYYIILFSLGVPLLRRLCPVAAMPHISIYLPMASAPPVAVMHSVGVYLPGVCLSGCVRSHKSAQQTSTVGNAGKIETPWSATFQTPCIVCRFGACKTHAERQADAFVIQLGISSSMLVELGAFCCLVRIVSMKLNNLAPYVYHGMHWCRAVAILEGDNGGLLSKLLAPLKLMTQLQVIIQSVAEALLLLSFAQPEFDNH